MTAYLTSRLAALVEQLDEMATEVVDHVAAGPHDTSEEVRAGARLADLVEALVNARAAVLAAQRSADDPEARWSFKALRVHHTTEARS